MQSQPIEDSTDTSTSTSTDNNQKLNHGLVLHDQRHPSSLAEAEGSDGSQPSSSDEVNVDARAPDSGSARRTLPRRLSSTSPLRKTSPTHRISEYEQAIVSLPKRAAASPAFKLIPRSQRPDNGGISVEDFPNGTFQARAFVGMADVNRGSDPYPVSSAPGITLFGILSLPTLSQSRHDPTCMANRVLSLLSRHRCFDILGSYISCKQR